MDARIALLALCATFARATQPAARIIIDTSSLNHRTEEPQTIEEDLEKRYTPELLEDLQKTKMDALLLYTEYTSHAAVDLKAFLKNISSLTQDTINTMDYRILDRAGLNSMKTVRSVCPNAYRLASNLVKDPLFHHLKD
ncbi:unnamed protein product [Euphydryas editha]|uniref:Uncharacterized protein n=1 Tax=Euphydryas editha TaxID=104508 RepID=A0AAU9TFP1_EUPED|nr:unnamed protein product [Euphydryas editha]